MREKNVRSLKRVCSEELETATQYTKFEKLAEVAIRVERRLADINRKKPPKQKRSSKNWPFGGPRTRMP